MKLSAGISKKFVLSLAVLFAVLILAFPLSFYVTTRTASRLVRESIMQSNVQLLMEKAGGLTEKLQYHRPGNPKDLAGAIRKLCAGDASFLHAFVFRKSADDNYFEVVDSIQLGAATGMEAPRNSTVQESTEINYLKGALFQPVADPVIRRSGPFYHQGLYMPFSLKGQAMVLEFRMSASRPVMHLRDYSDAMARIIKYIILFTAAIAVAVVAASALFIHNFSLLIRGLSRSIEKAARGELDVNMNPAVDDELTELALSFNSLIGELKARDKIVQELENRDSLGDIFKFGVSLLRENRLEDAIALFRTLTFLKPDGFGSYFNLGVAYAKKGDYVLSVEMFEKALLSNPRHELTLRYIEKVKRLLTSDGQIPPGPS